MMKPIFVVLYLLISITSLAVSRNSSLPIIDYTDKVDYGHELTLEKRNIDLIVIHSSYYLNEDSFSVDGVMKQYKEYDVAPHYLIDRDGVIFQLVDERNVAYHAGKSVLPTDSDRTNLNKTSIGIELINTPTTPPTDRQYQSLLHLVQDIKSRYNITYVLGHSDIADGRKTDPWCFNWPVFNIWVWGNYTKLSKETRMAIEITEKKHNKIYESNEEKEKNLTAEQNNNITINNKQ